MKRYRILNDAIGWLMFVIAAVTYLLTIEPTASFWDCPEFISQGYKLEIGHPPGNPIFMLAARFFVNFAPGPEYVAMAVNSMSALLSAATILLLFWTITMLVKRLVVKDNAESISTLDMVMIFASGICGSLMYTWSDTFWFSAVEGEVYAFSSFCTALVFWLILKWENRADDPHSDRYLVLIAYVIGISIAVHLLNLLCIPAIVLVFYYRKFKNTDARGSIVSLLISFAIVALILYGLVPGFIEMAQYSELLFVNVMGMSYNAGTLIYAIVTLGVMIWAVRELYIQRNATAIKVSVFLSVFLSGIPFIGESMWIPVVLSAGLLYYLFGWMKRIPVRILNVIILSILVIFIGYSSYALLLIRSAANTPMNQNAPDNVFALSSYLNREQYGQHPLLYGPTFNSSILYQLDAKGVPHALREEGRAIYGKAVKTNPDDPDRYVVTGYKTDYKMVPELNMLFPRMYESRYVQDYKSWSGMTGTPVYVTPYIDTAGNPVESARQAKIKPTMAENRRYFLNYQLNHMYWRYFLWNFAGRQNDLQGNGEVTHGNWISGIPFLDNIRLGDQSLLPDDLGKGNKGHNKFYLLPLLMGIIGICWQAFISKRGIEQFWVVAFLFFMTGIAIVIYLNQTPNEPRERDYAFAGSFYAYAIWVGMGVAGLWHYGMGLLKNQSRRNRMAVAGVCSLVAIAVPLQVVSQTWDDHDRSGRYTARDFGMNYLSSLDENAIVFTNGDNDTFPLWYAQEVEGYRTDVRVVNLSYLTTGWYVDQLRYHSYDALPVPMMATPGDYANDSLQFAYIIDPDTTAVNAIGALRALYDKKNSTNHTFNLREVKYPNMYIPLDADALVKAGRIPAERKDEVADAITLNFMNDPESGMRLSKIIATDMLAADAEQGWPRPVYFAMTVSDDLYMGLHPHLQLTGMTYEVSGTRSADGQPGVNTDKAYDNIVNKFRWGGLDKVKSPDDIYLDETVRRMVTSTRSAMLDVATALYNEGITAEVHLMADSASMSTEEYVKARNYVDERYRRSRELLDLMMEKLPVAASPLGVAIGPSVADLYTRLGDVTGNEDDAVKARDLLEHEIDLYKQYVIYIQSLSPDKFALLTRTDRYIYDTMFMNLLQLYANAEGDTEQLLRSLQDDGVDFSRYYRQMSRPENQPTELSDSAE
ncbi:MAG: DUF2723 domain-containing protein [Muribaculum sp.]|nr:DUF2723 domain-containing protein [Muribaculum sp.]